MAKVSKTEKCSAEDLIEEIYETRCQVFHDMLEKLFGKEDANTIGFLLLEFLDARDAKNKLEDATTFLNR
jgi:hypothetical protein